ncbi:MAG: glycerate kinase [Bacteroidota bacterium]
MRVLIACDKFKGSLTTFEVNAAIAKGIQQAHPEADIHTVPIADGGDGSLSVIASIIPSEEIWVDTIDAVGRPIQAHYLISGDTAYIEMAQASGLVLINEASRNPLHTHTIGTGLLMKYALNQSVKKMVLFIGGSATNDAGIGIAHALGFQFLDSEGRELPPSGQNLAKIHEILSPTPLPDFELSILTDVSNPFTGPEGAVYTYARQKGAKEDDLLSLEMGMIHFSQILHKQFGVDISQMPGAGAAGGISGGLHALMGAHLQEGFPTLGQLADLETHIQQADLIITGEGQLDSQSIQGKVVGQIAALCQKYDKQLIVMAGNNTLSQDTYQQAGISQVHHIMSVAKDLKDAMENGGKYLEGFGENLSK